MALDKAGLKAGIKAAMVANISGKTGKQMAEIDKLSGAIADSIDTYVKGIIITYTAGLTAPPGGGPVVGDLGYTIS